MEWNRLHREGVCTRSRGASACKKIHEGLRFRLMACQATILFSLVAFLSLSLSLSLSPAACFLADVYSPFRIREAPISIPAKDN